MKHLILGFLLTCGHITFCQTYEYHPKSSLTLGYGIDLRNLSDGKAISPIKSPLKLVFANPAGTVKTEFSQSLILTEDQLSKSFVLDAKVSARYMGFNASGHFSIDRKEMLNSRNLTVLLYAENNYGDQYIDFDKDDLTTDAKKLIDHRSYDRFINNDGNYFVNKVERASKINVFITLRNVESSFRETVAKGATAGGKGMKWAASASVNINQAISTANQNRNVTVNIQSNGDASGFSGLKDLLDLALGSSNPLETLTNTLKNYMAGFTRENSPISKYYLSSMTSFDIPREYIKWNATTEELLMGIAATYDRLAANKDLINEIKSNPTFITLSTKQEKQAIEQELRHVNNAMIQLMTTKDNCLTRCQRITNLTECCTSATLQMPELPVTERYYKIVSKFDTYKDGITIRDKGEEYILLDETLPRASGKKLKLKIRFYYIPVLKGSPHEPIWPNINRYMPDLQLRVNDKIVAHAPNLEKGGQYVAPQVYPVPIVDASGSTISYSNFWLYSLDDILLAEERVKVSIKFVDIPGVPAEYPFNQLKFHPGLYFQASLSQ